MAEDLSRLDATAQAELVRSGEASPSELVDAAIERIEALNPELNAVIHPLFEKARAAAGGELPDGPFRGVPMVVKDLIATTEGDPFHMGMQFLKDRNFVAPFDSYLVERFRAAGFVICGKTNTPELGIVPTTEPDAYGPSRNPWDTTRSTGGSSGGSAAAVASGMVPVGHANDGGGSIRIPASACGLVGLKPTRGRVSLGPAIGDISSGLVNELVVTRSVRDTAAVLDAVQGPAPGDPYVAPEPSRPYVEELGSDPGRLRIGLNVEPLLDIEIHPDVIAAARATADLLGSLGHEVAEAAPGPFDGFDLMQSFTVRWAAAQTEALDKVSLLTGEKIGEGDVEPLTWALAEMGRQFSAGEYLEAVGQHQMMSRMVAGWYEGGFDLILTPTLGEPPPPLGTLAQDPADPLAAFSRAAVTGAFTAAVNITGQPAISLPLHWNDEGLPIGVHLVATCGREDVLIRVASQLEQAAPWAERSPSVSAAAPPAAGQPA